LPSIENLKQRWQGFRDAAERPSRCLFCPSGRIWWNGVRIRSASVRGDGPAAVYIPDIACPQVKCARCRKCWTLRPEGLGAQRHYQLCVVADATARYLFEPEQCLDNVGQAVGCDRRTVGRWVEWLAALAEPADLLRHVLHAAGAPIVARMHPAAPVARNATSAAWQAVRHRASQVLSLLEALGAALGWEPPALRSVLSAVWGGRYRATTYARPSLPDFARRLLWGLGPVCPHGP